MLPEQSMTNAMSTSHAETRVVTMTRELAECDEITFILYITISSAVAERPARRYVSFEMLMNYA